MVYSPIRHRLIIVWGSHLHHGVRVLNLFMRNLFLWRHFENISVRLFSRSFRSAFIMHNFSSRQRLPRLAPLLYPHRFKPMEHAIHLQLPNGSPQSTRNPITPSIPSTSQSFTRQYLKISCKEQSLGQNNTQPSQRKNSCSTGKSHGSDKEEMTCSMYNNGK